MESAATQQAPGAKRDRRKERGIALIMVLGVLVVVGLMAGHIAVLSETVDAESRVAALRSGLKYAAESAADRALWFHLVDRRLFKKRRLGLDMSERDAADLEEAWMLDGKTHEFKESGCRVALRDAIAGLDFSGNKAASKLRPLLIAPEAEEEERVGVEDFLDVLADYIDPDDALHLNGKEIGDYQADGYANLPRNGPLQFREEVHWLDGSEIILTGSGRPRIVPPAGLAFPKSKQKRIPFFSSSRAEIERAAKVSPEEAEQLVLARTRFQTLGELLEENLDPHLLQLAYSNFSFDESVIVTVIAEASSPTGEVKRVLRVTRDCRLKAVNAFSSNQRECLANWEKIVF